MEGQFRCVFRGVVELQICPVQPWRTVHQEAGAFLSYQILRWESLCKVYNTKDFEIIFKLPELQRRHFRYSIEYTTLEALEFGAISP